LSVPGLDATNWRAELAIRFGVLLRKVRGGSRTWVGARVQSVLMSVWRTCWQHGLSALDCLSQLLRGPPMALASPLFPTHDRMARWRAFRPQHLAADAAGTPESRDRLLCCADRRPTLY
jgi:hypothetical protein